MMVNTEAELKESVAYIHKKGYTYYEPPPPPPSLCNAKTG